MSMKTYSEWDAFVDVDFSRYSLRELQGEMCRISKASADGRKIEKKIEDIDRKYASITERHGTMENWFASPLKLLRLTEEELNDIIPNIQKDGVQPSHIRRLLHLGEKGANDFASWEGAQPPQTNTDLASDAYDVQVDIVTLLAGPKALEKIGFALQTYVGSKLPVAKPSMSKESLSMVRGGRGRPQESKMEGRNILFGENSAEIPKAADLAHAVCSILFRHTQTRNRKDWQMEWLDVHEQIDGSVELRGKDLEKAKKRIKNSMDAINEYTANLSTTPLFEWTKGMISRNF